MDDNTIPKKLDIANEFVEEMIQAETFFDIFGIKEIDHTETTKIAIDYLSIRQFGGRKDYGDLVKIIGETTPEDKIKEYIELLRGFCQGIGNENAFMEKFYKK